MLLTLHYVELRRISHLRKYSKINEISLNRIGPVGHGRISLSPLPTQGQRTSCLRACLTFAKVRP
jgi:hypothetical protein